MREHLVTALDAVFLLVVGLLCLALAILIGFMAGPAGFLLLGLLLFGNWGRIVLGIVRGGAGLDRWARRRLGVD